MPKSNERDLEQYIKSLQAKEKSGRKKMVGIGIGVAAAALLAAVGLKYTVLDAPANSERAVNVSPVSQQSLVPKPFVVFAADEAQLETLARTFEEENAYVVIANETQRDTFYSLSDYLSSPAFLQASTVDAASEEVTAEDSENYTIGAFSLELIGAPEVGKPVVFSIKGADPKVKYLVELGDGQQQAYSRAFDHTYITTGTFIAKVNAVAPDGSTKEVSRRIIVTPPPPVASEPAKAAEPTPSTARSSNVEESRPTASTSTRPVDDSEQRQLAERLAAKPAAPVAVEESQSKPKAEKRQPLAFSSVRPEFPGGESAMYKFLGKEMRYPDDARRNRVQGKVVVQFVVGEDGSISDAQVLRGIGHGCDEEALRVVSQMPAWKAGEQNGSKVPVIYTLPISFKMAN